jgi:protein-L-isoaspartate(D-aspartate) O-methyltransferase
MEIPLGQGQVMLAPCIEARMLQDAAVQKHEKVLEIGTGSGYMAALLAHRAQRVISLEINPELAQIARANLQKAGIHNVEVRQFDGSKGVSADGPFDVIMLSGSVAEVPQALLAQLKIGGRLIGIVGDEPTMRVNIVTRISDAEFKTSTPWDTVAPRLLNFPEPSHFHF